MKTIGILGAGQLGAYLCRAARDLDLQTIVIGSRPDDPAMHFADHYCVGAFDDARTLRYLGQHADIITFDMEAIPINALSELERMAGRDQFKLAPSSRNMKLVQNKWRQKQWLERLKLPTADYIDCTDRSADEIARHVGVPFAQKRFCNGYDGRGVQIVRTLEGPIWTENTFAERYVHPAREFALLVARNARGDIAAYPLMETTFDGRGNVLQEVSAPADVESAIAKDAEYLATRVVDELRGTGLFAVEMFLSPQEGLLINEISPRVHNAGHLTLEACATSQFEQHLRAIANMPLGSTQLHSAAVMTNILNRPELSHGSFVPRISEPEPGTRLHWYGKRGDKPLRKLGHITSTHQNLTAARTNANRALDALHGEQSAAA
jgi:5-(carboxyamino)imidazole ribonucleotide synthase